MGLYLPNVFNDKYMIKCFFQNMSYEFILKKWQFLNVLNNNFNFLECMGDHLKQVDSTF